jgi:hypothetical protein
MTTSHIAAIKISSARGSGGSQRGGDELTGDIVKAAIL